jgi:predicted metal-dependent peptidase
MSRDKELDKTKIVCFTSKGDAFLGCLLCSLDFIWDTKATQTACICENKFYWNPLWFDELTPQERQAVLLHELWHVALLHANRIGNRDPERWNIACDLRINSMLTTQGFKLPEGACYNPEYDLFDYSEEEIYETLEEGDQIPPPQTWGTCDFNPSPDQVALVQNAVSTARMAGNLPGEIEQLLKEFLKPKLNWRQILRNYLLEKIDPDYSWNRPNRRYRDIYMPSFLPSDGKLLSIAMFLDTSGSISPEALKRFNSEVKFVQEVLNPEKLSVVQFDTIIQDEQVYTEYSNFNKVKLKGFGGTNYECVRQYILKYKPTLSIIFTDLYADPMEEVKSNLIWIVSNNTEDAPQGITIHVDQ